MRRQIMKAMTLLLAFCTAILGWAMAETQEAPVVYVTISAEGALALVRQEVELTDVDGDGALTINDALIAAHEAAFEGGAEAGYGADTGEYGLYITKLWGVENGGSYGYCKNNAACASLSDPAADGDEIVAYTYADLESWSDAYAYFDAFSMNTSAKEETVLVLKVSGFDADWNPVETPLEGAVITVNGEVTEVVTDMNGQALISLGEPGEYVVSAAAADMILVPPVCVITVE